MPTIAPVEPLVAALANELPELKYDIDTCGATWLDFKGPLADISVEVRPEQGYGIHSDPEPGFGSGPGKVVPTVDEVLNELRALSKAVAA